MLEQGYSFYNKFLNFQHPYIYPVTYSSCADKGATIVRVFHSQGTVKDLICKVGLFYGQLGKFVFLAIANTNSYMNYFFNAIEKAFYTLLHFHSLYISNERLIFGQTG